MSRVTSYGYDALGRQISVTNPAIQSSPLLQRAYTLAGLVASLTDANSNTTNFAYDGFDRLATTTYPLSSTEAFTCDALNRYTTVGAVSPTYDGNSNLTSDGTFTLGYDAENRLTSASGAGNTASYTWDAQGRRKTRTVNGTTTVFVTDATNREVLEYDGATGAIQRWYAYGLGSNEVLNQINIPACTRTALIPDIQGSIIATLDSTATSLTKAGYLPYGASANAPSSFGYTGQRIDPEIGGLYYYRARHYSPAWGRFLQPDPIGYVGGINLYAYTDNDPLNQTDPSGNCPACVGAIIGGVGGLLFQAGSDLFHGSLSSASTYAGAIVGGAAGGAAATICGPACAGAVAGAASNLTTNGLNGNLSLGSLAASTAIGAIGGAVAGQLTPAAFLSLPRSFNSVKGDIGEQLSVAAIMLQGDTIVERNASNRVGKSTYDFLLGNGTYVESKFGTSQLSGPQRAAQTLPGNDLTVHYWDYRTVSGFLGSGPAASSAGPAK